MLILYNKYDGNFYDSDYFENGKQSGKGWLENYHWMPIRSVKEALAYIEYFGLEESSKVLDFGCAKGFIVKALRFLGIDTDGCDISDYALSFTEGNCWNCEEIGSFLERVDTGYTHVIAKDVFEHMTKDQLPEILDRISILSDKLMCVIPMGENKKYIIPEYHQEISHQIIENKNWWANTFMFNGWKVIKETNHVEGLKDNWMHYPDGNHVFVLEKQ